VFVDDDGQAYLYWGQPEPVVRKAERRHDLVLRERDPDPADHRGIRHPQRKLQPPTLYEEGPWVYKRNGLYYNVFAAECCSEFIGYSTAPGRPARGPTAAPSCPAGQQLHQPPGVIDFNGNSYFFYHNGACRAAAATPARSPWRGSPTTPTAPSRRST
jgi:beta-xylosidase